jgi:hypothetical protein
MTTDYPPTPWRFRGKFWAGVFKTSSPIELPPGLKPVLNRRWLVVMVIRYLEGTLQYDELAFGVLARWKAYAGLYVPYIWVNDLASLHGGREIWGVPKVMANFVWDEKQENKVSISDHEGPILTLEMGDGGWLPPVWLVMPGMGHVENHWAYGVSRMRAKLRRTNLRMAQWSGRFPWQVSECPMFRIAASQFRAVFPTPKLLPDGVAELARSS